MLLQLNHADVIIIHNSKNAVTFKLFSGGKGEKQLLMLLVKTVTLRLQYFSR